jgi:hypothetical protein
VGVRVMVFNDTFNNISVISWRYNKYRITAVLKVKTDIIASITASQTGGAVILVIMYVEIFKTDVIVLIGDETEISDILFSCSMILFIGKLNIFSLMCAAD